MAHGGHAAAAPGAAPASFRCPITGELMREPVVDPEGHTYEKSAIMGWLERNTTSPMTRTYLTADMLKPNRAVQDAIAEMSGPLGCEGSGPHAAGDGAAGDEAAAVPEAVALHLAPFSLESGDEVGIEVRIEPPEGATTAPLDIVAVIDVSGSMDSAATVEQGGQSVDVGYSVLDVTKHAVKTLIASLRPKDRLSVVAFSNSARCVMDWLPMTPANQTMASTLVQGLQTEGATNLWDGLRVALRQVKASPRTGAVSSLLLLTDEGAQGTELRVIGGDPADVDAYGPAALSLNLDSLHLGQPRTLVLAVKPAAGHTLAALEQEEVVHAALCYTDARGEHSKVVGSAPTLRSWPAASSTQGPSAAASPAARWREAALRLEFVRLLSSLVPAKDGADLTLAAKQAAVQAFVEGHQDAHAGHGILVDAEAQVKLAVSREDWWTRWGLNYVCSLQSAHRQQRCNNFKDKGVAGYGGRVFEAEREHADEIFANLAPPVASRRVGNDTGAAAGCRRSGGRRSCGGAPGGGRSFRALFNDSNNGCFHGDCLVRMADGSRKKISAVVKGDRVARPAALSADGRARKGGEAEDDAAVVVCVVRTECKDGEEDMVSLQGGALVLTPWHPVLDAASGRWAFPDALAQQGRVPCSSVFNLVLASGHVIDVGGAACVTLAHGIVDDEVARHDYFGTAAVLADLRGMGRGFDDGLLVFRHGCIARAPDGRVVGYQKSHLVPVAS